MQKVSIKTAQPIILLMMVTENQNNAFNEVERLKANLNYFIPEVKNINGKLVPSIPFVAKHKQPLFIGDVIEIAYKSDGEICFEISMVNLVNGEYVSTCKNEVFSTPMHLHDPKTIKVLGNAEQNPELLSLLTD